VKRLVVATLNPDKLGELARLLDLSDLELVSLAAFPGASAPDETGETLEANARIKARAAMAFTGLPALADDTGLEVEALGGRPGVHAARFAGPNARYADNVAKLLRALEGVPAGRRSARFRTVCVVCFPGGDELRSEGVLDGSILTAPRGEQGFGYDPVFALPDGRALAELSADQKNAISHRARAVHDLKSRLAGRML
jgi:XTP/dITP diphosphohydrolase